MRARKNTRIIFVSVLISCVVLLFLGVKLKSAAEQSEDISNGSSLIPHRHQDSLGKKTTPLPVQETALPDSSTGGSAAPAQTIPVSSSAQVPDRNGGMPREVPEKVQSWLKLPPTPEAFSEGIVFLKDADLSEVARLLVLDKLHSWRRHLGSDNIKTLFEQVELISANSAQPSKLRSRALGSMATLLVAMQEQNLVVRTDVETYFPFFMNVSQDKEAPTAVRGGAIRALGILKAGCASEMLAETLNAPENINEPQLVRNASLALVQIQGDGAVKQIGNIMETTTNEAIFGTAAFSLGQIHTPDSLVVLVRTEARFPNSGSTDASLANMEDTILSILRNPDDPNLVSAVKATEHLWKDGQRERYLPLLRSLLASAQLPVKIAVAERLMKTAQSLPPDKRQQELSLILPIVSDNRDLAGYEDKINCIMNGKPLFPSADSVSTTPRTIGNKSGQEYGDAVYRILKSASWAGYNYNHAGIFAGQSLGTKRCIEADTFTGDTTIDNDFANSFTDYGSDYYGAFQLSNRTLTFGQRRAILATARQIADADIPYTFFSALDPTTAQRPVEISNIDNIRCDGVVEYCYENNSYQSWWNTGSPSHWDISLYPEEHNDTPDFTVNPDVEESPWAQRGAPSSSDEGPGFSGDNPHNAYLSKSAITENPTCQASYVYNGGNLDVTVNATDVSGIARIAYKINASGTWQYTDWQTQYPTSDSYSCKFSITNSCTLYYFAEDNGGNFPASATGIKFSTVNSSAGTGGTITPATSLIVPDGENRDYSAAPDADYAVEMWHLDGSVVRTGGESYTLTDIQADHDLQVTFTYLPTAHNLTVNYGSGTGPYAVETVVPISADTPTSDKTFDKWTGDTQYIADVNSSSTTVTMPAADVIVTATYKDLHPSWTLTITVDPSDSGITSPPMGAYTVSADKYFSISATANQGYVFSNWTATANATLKDANFANTSVAIGADATVTANFARIVTLTMAASPDASGTTNPAAGAHNLAAGAARTITAIPAHGYKFVNWTATAEATIADATRPSTTVTLSDGATVTANFEAIPATAQLTIAASPGSAGTTTPALGVCQVNTQEAVSIAAIPASGHHFLNWTATANASIANLISASTTVSLLGDATVTANFEAEQATAQLTMAISPAESGTTVPTQGTATVVNVGAATDIAATPSTGFSFVCWTGSNANALFTDCRAASTTAIITGNVTVTANFDQGVLEDKVSVGKIYALNISDIQWPPLAQTLANFAKKPKVYATYKDPINKNDRSSTLNVLTRIEKGKPVDSVACEWTGKIALLDRKVWTADKTRTTQQILEANQPAPLICGLFVSGEDGQKVKVKNIDTHINVALQPPEISCVQNNYGQTVSSIAIGVAPQKITIVGKLFGKAVPSAWMEYVNEKGEVKQLKLKLDNKTPLKHKDAAGKPSYMDIVTGVSEFAVLIPADGKLPKGWQPGEHDIVIDNKVCRATIVFQTEK